MKWEFSFEASKRRFFQPQVMRLLGLSFLFPALTTLVVACTGGDGMALSESCDSAVESVVPVSALAGHWSDSDDIVRTGISGVQYWVRKNHVLTRDDQITTRESLCADKECFEVRAEFTHFGSYRYTPETGRVDVSYRKHFSLMFDSLWASENFDVKRCFQNFPENEVIELQDRSCLTTLGIRSDDFWKLTSATLQRLTFKSCDDSGLLSDSTTRTLVRSF